MNEIRIKMFLSIRNLAVYLFIYQPQVAATNPKNPPPMPETAPTTAPRMPKISLHQGSRAQQTQQKLISRLF
jgi:hypothetical protein